MKDGEGEGEHDGDAEGDGDGDGDWEGDGDGEGDRGAPGVGEHDARPAAIAPEQISGASAARQCDAAIVEKMFPECEKNEFASESAETLKIQFSMTITEIESVIGQISHELFEKTQNRTIIPTSTPFG
jgi:hypothetical protein